MATWSKRVLPGPVMDPYAEWAEETDFAYLGAAGASPAEQRYPVLIELNKGKGRDARAFAALARKERGSLIRVADLYQQPPAGLERASFISASVSKAFFTEPLPRALRESIRRFEIGLPVRGYATPAPRKRNLKKAAGHTVITAVIDDGIGFAHDRFRRPLGSRMEYFWNQDGAAELDRGMIENALLGSTHGALVDEDELYRATAQVDFARPGHKPIAQRRAHGTHVMHLACGEDPANPPASRPVIGVQLPVATTADTSGATLAPQVLDALWYILNRADSLAAPPARVAVNLSYGMIAGPHDGSSILEQAIDEMIQLRGNRLRIVLPAGNSYLARCHARFDLGKHGEQALRWRIQPEDRTLSFQEIWLPKARPGRKRKVEIKVVPPGGDESGWVQEGEEHVWRPGSDILCKVLYLLPGAARDRAMIFIAVAPTATLHPTRAVAPSGTWTVRIRNLAPKTATIDAWIQRDDTPFGYPRRGRQSRFDDAAYRYRDGAGRLVETDNASYIKRAGTANAIATGSRPIVIGGFRRKAPEAAKYSAAGSAPTANGGIAIRGPDALAVSEDSQVYQGLLAAGVRSRTSVALNGTSVAAPQVTRWVAGRLAAGAASGPAAVRAKAVAAPAIPAQRGGAGLIEFPPLVDRKIEA